MKTFVEFEGRQQTIADWAKEFGLDAGALQSRIARGWPIDRALVTPSSKYNGVRGQTKAELFWTHVDKQPGDGCWLWTGVRRYEYGVFRGVGGKSHAAHRFSFFLEHGREAEGLVLHKCNVPLCVRPEHLEEGDQKRNIQYAANLGRIAHGSRQGSARLKEDQVREIFLRYKVGDISQQRLANEFGCSQGTVAHIVLRKKWRRATEGL